MNARGRVLIVEADWIVAQGFSRILERHGFEVPQVAANAEDALRFYEETRPDIVLLDLDLNGAIDGIELAIEMDAIGPVSVVFVTLLDDDRGYERIKGIGSFVYVVKPASESQLLGAVELLLNRFGSDRETPTKRLTAEIEFGRLLDAVPDAIVIFDADGRILRANAEIERHFGYGVNEIAGQNVQILIPEAVRSEYMKHRARFDLHTHSGRMREMMQMSARRADGSELAVEVSLTPIGTGPGMQVIAIIRDMSPRVLLEQTISEQRKLVEQLDRVLRLETVGRLAGGIAHDFNNLLLVIGGYADALLGDISDSRAQRLGQGIRAATDRAAELTRQLLAFGRRQVLLPAVVDPAAAVASVRRMLTRVIGEDVQIVTTCDPLSKRVKVDPTQIEHVLLNLALNARDAMPNGGILRFEVTNFDVAMPVPLPSSSVAVVPCGQYVMLAVRDNGLGIEPGVVAHVFEPFFTTKAPGKGTGLGLATVYGIVKQSGGFVWIESVPGSGTSVYVLLPATLETDVGLETIPQRDVTARGGGTVMVVEDEPEVRALLVESLAEAGYDVVEMANGRDAVDAFIDLGGRVDIIVTDVIMPYSNGPALVRAARQYRPDLRALYISGYADDQMVAEIETDTNSEYLQKPFSRDALLRKISVMLARQPE